MIEEFDYQKSCRELLRIMQEKGLNLQDLLDMKYKKESEKIRAVGNLRITPYAEKLEKENKELKQQFASLHEKIEELKVIIPRELYKKIGMQGFNRDWKSKENNEYWRLIDNLIDGKFEELQKIFKEMGQ